MNKLLLVLSILLVIPITACKKGDNDPFLSLSSRKARMHGEWEISAMEYNERNTNTEGDYTDITESYSDQSITKVTVQYVAQSGASVVDSSILVIQHNKYTFDKNGTWTRELTTQEIFGSVQDIGGGEMTYDTLITTIDLTESGDWSFLGKLKGEYKNKERIVMNVLTSSTSSQSTTRITTTTSSDTTMNETIGDEVVEVLNYHSGENNTIIEIDQLKRKEMVFIEKRRNSGSVTVSPYQGSTTTSDNDTFYSDARLVLVRI